MVMLILMPVVSCLGVDLPFQKNQTAHTIMENIAACKFEQARIVIDSMLSIDSSDALAWMLLMAQISLQQLDYDQSSDSDSFQKTYEQTKNVLAVDNNSGSADSDFLTIKGITQLIASAYAMHRKKYISALKSGFNALDLCKEAKKIDSANADVDFMLGLYAYARAELKRKFLGILFWYSGDKRSGIRIIKNSSRNARLISLVADMALQEIYVREGVYDQAASGIERLLASYPGSRFVLWTKAKLFDAQKMPDRAAEVYGTLADAYEQIHAAQKNYFTTRFLEAKRYFEAKNNQKALAVCNRLLAECKGTNDDNCDEIEDLLIKIRRETGP